MWTEYSVAVVIVLLVIVLVRQAVVYVRAEEAVVVERGGKLNRALAGGWHVLVPFLDRRRPMYWRTLETGLDGKQRVVDRLRWRIDMRETQYELTGLEVTTSDQIPFKLDVSYSVAVQDPLRAVVAHTHLPEALGDILAGAVQQQLSKVNSESLLKNLAEAISAVRDALSRRIAEFGLKLGDLQSSSAVCSDEIRAAVEEKIAANTKKEAAMLEAETTAETMLAEARTKQQVEALAAESKRQSIELMAAAEAEAIRTVSAAMTSPELTRHAMATRYLEVMRQMAANPNAKLVFVPFDIGLLSGHADWIRQLVDDKAEG